MADYDVRAQQQAARQLAPKSRGGKGQAVVLTWLAAGAYDTNTGKVVQPAPALQTCSGLEEQYRAFQIDGTAILTGDTKFMLSPLTEAGTVVDLHDGADGKFTLTLADGTVKSVIRVEPFRPAGLLVYAYLQLRGAG